MYPSNPELHTYECAAAHEYKNPRVFPGTRWY